MKKKLSILFVIVVSVIIILLNRSLSPLIIPKLNLCELHSFDYYRNQLYSDTLNWDNDTSTINWYLPYIKKIINRVERNCKDTSHLVYPYKKFNEVVFYNNSIGIVGKKLNNKQIIELLSIINNPLYFSWGETTFETDKIIVFKSDGNIIAKLSIMDYNYIISEPQNTMMKFGALKEEGVKKLYELLNSIEDN